VSTEASPNKGQVFRPAGCFRHECAGVVGAAEALPAAVNVASSSVAFVERSVNLSSFSCVGSEANQSVNA
jgi:hypothetical protein